MNDKPVGHICPRQEDITILVIRGIILTLVLLIVSTSTLVWRMIDVFGRGDDVPASVAGLAGSLATAIGTLGGGLIAMLTSVGRSGSSAEPLKTEVTNTEDNPVHTDPTNATELAAQEARAVPTTNPPPDPTQPVSGAPGAVPGAFKSGDAGEIDYD